MLSIKTHLRLKWPAECLAFFVGVEVGSRFGEALLLTLALNFGQVLNSFLCFLLGAFMGFVVFLAMRSIFRNLLPARCDHASCRGPAYCFGTSPMRYICQRCGQEYLTTVYEDDQVGRKQWHR